MRTWIIVDLLVVSALVGAWVAWRIGKRRFDRAEAATTSTSMSASTPPVDGDGSPGTPAAADPQAVDAGDPADSSSLQVVVDVAQGRGEPLLASLRPALGIEAADDAGEPLPPCEASGVELHRPSQATGSLAADRLVFHTDGAPTLLTNVLQRLRELGYEIEMVVHHEVILYDVDAGVARIRLSRAGDSRGVVEGARVRGRLPKAPRSSDVLDEPGGPRSP